MENERLKSVFKRKMQPDFDIGELDNCINEIIKEIRMQFIFARHIDEPITVEILRLITPEEARKEALLAESVVY